MRLAWLDRRSANADHILETGFQPDVIVLDLHVRNGERGDNYASRLRANPRTAKVPIIIMSGAIETTSISPGTVTLAKPFDMDTLYNVLADLCARE